MKIHRTATWLALHQSRRGHRIVSCNHIPQRTQRCRIELMPALRSNAKTIVSLMRQRHGWMRSRVMKIDRTATWLALHQSRRGTPHRVMQSHSAANSTLPH